MLPVNPEAIGLFGLFATVICFGLEQVGVGVKGADHAKLTRSLGYIAIFFGGFTQLFTGVCMYLSAVTTASISAPSSASSACSGSWLASSS